MGGGGFPALRPAAAAAVKLVYRLIAFLSGRSCFLSRQTLNSQIQDFINQTSLFHFFFTFFFSVLPFPYIMFSTLFLLYLTSIKILQFVLIAVLVRLHKCVNVCHWHCSCVNVYSVVFMCHKLKFVWWQKGSLILLHVCFFIRMCASIHPVLFIIVQRSSLYLSMSVRGLKTHTEPLK